MDLSGTSSGGKGGRNHSPNRAARGLLSSRPASSPRVASRVPGGRRAGPALAFRPQDAEDGLPPRPLLWARPIVEVTSGEAEEAHCDSAGSKLQGPVLVPVPSLGNLIRATFSSPWAPLAPWVMAAPPLAPSWDVSWE